MNSFESDRTAVDAGSATLSENVREIKDFLNANADRDLNKVEIAGIVSLLQGSVNRGMSSPWSMTKTLLTKTC
jgi:hypothetical protein